MAGEGGGESAVADVVRALRQGERQVVNFKTFVPLNLEFGEVFQFDWRKKVRWSAAFTTGSRCRT